MSGHHQRRAAVPAAGGGGALAYRSAATTNTSGSSSTSVTVNKPSGVVDGDFMVCAICLDNPSNGYTAPSGWTERQNSDLDHGGANGSVWTKQAGSSEPSSYTWTLVQGRKHAACIMATVGGTYDTIASTESGDSLDTPTAPSATVAEDGSIVFRTVHVKGTSFTALPSGVTEVFNHNGDVMLWCGYEEDVSAGASGTAQWTTADSKKYDTNTVVVGPST